MWRAIPLTKIVLRMIAFGVILGVAQGLSTIVMLQSSILAPRAYYHQQIMKGEVVDAAILCALIGVALACYAAVIHRTIHKPHRFKFAFVIVAMIVSLLVVQEPFHVVTVAELGIRPGQWFQWALADTVIGPLLLVTIAKHVAVGLMSLYVAGRYLREATAKFMKSTGQTSD